MVVVLAQQAGVLCTLHQAHTRIDAENVERTKSYARDHDPSLGWLPHLVCTLQQIVADVASYVAIFDKVWKTLCVGDTGGNMSTDLAAPLADRAELASRDWIRVAGGFLATQNSRVSGLDAPFKCSSEFTNPPPHLARDRESIAYTITFASDGITIDDTLDPGADRFQTADYNSALPFAWLVHRDNEDIGRLIHEYEHLFGDKVDDPIQRTPTPTTVQAILNDLHDHMAVRTINNPDIEHRARYLGLSNNLADLDDVGYTVMPGAFTASYADALRAETHRNHAGREEGASFRATMLLKRGRIWEEAVIHPWVLTVVEYLIGRGCLLYQSDTIVKTTGQETHSGLHSDYGASRITEPFPEYCVEATAIWAIDDFHKEHGPTCVVPGSFRERSMVPPGMTQENAKLIEMDRGSIAFWHGATWHGATPRTALGKRSSLHNAYCRSFIRPLERYDDIDPAIVRRNPPVFSTLCGLDDAFGKSGLDGANFERLGYAAKHGYASSAPPVVESA